MHPSRAGNGRHKAVYNATKTGNYSLEVVDVADGEHAVGSPFHVVIEPNQAFAPATLVWWDRQVREQISFLCDWIDRKNVSCPSRIVVCRFDFGWVGQARRGVRSTGSCAAECSINDEYY